MSQELCEKIMRLYLTEVGQNGKIELLDDIAAEDMVDHTAVALGWGAGRSGLKQHVKVFHQCLSDPEITIERIVASQNEVVGIWRVRGIHRGVTFGIPATGKVIEWSNASIFRIKEGKIIDYTGVFDGLEAIRQMGAKIELPQE